ncbi:MAG: sigma-70 family RNA polymerase sigma factor [Aggregatilineales bacterium]
MMLFIVLPDVTVDDSLLSRIQRGEQDAVLEVYETYFDSLYHYVRLKAGDAAVAEDIVSDVFVKLMEAIGTKSAPHSHLRGWLFQVARHLLYQHYGRNQSVSLTQLEDWMPASPDLNPEVQTAQLFDMQRLRHAMRMLNGDHQEVILLRFGQHLSLQETADIMGKSVSAIKSLQFRAVDNLRNILNPTDSPEENHAG